MINRHLAVVLPSLPATPSVTAEIFSKREKESRLKKSRKKE